MRARFLAPLLVALACGQANQAEEKKAPAPAAAPAPAPAPVAASTPAPVPAPASVPATAPAPALAGPLPGEVWVSFALVPQGAPNEEGAVNSKVILRVQEPGKPLATKEFGPHLNCNLIEKTELPKDAVAGVYCFWAGAGDRYTVAPEQGELVLRYLGMDEEAPEGKPEPKFKQALPVGATVKAAP